MLSVDLSLHIPGADTVDGPEMEDVLIESISQCETELLRESLRDLLNSSELEGKLVPSVSSTELTQKYFLCRKHFVGKCTETS